MRRFLLSVVEFFLHLHELRRELSGHEEHTLDPAEERRFRLEVPRSPGCYPHYVRLEPSQVVYEDDFL